jgi:hypothetical protein
MVKPIFRFSVVLGLVSILLGGCKSDSTSSNSSSNTFAANTMTATINGKTWKSDGVVGFRFAPTATPNLQFEGWVNEPNTQIPSDQIPFNVSPAITAPGTYPLVANVNSLTDMTASVAFNTDTASFSDYVSGSMTITVLTSTNVQGTFSFKATGGPNEDTVIVSNGQFNIPLQ